MNFVVAKPIASCVTVSPGPDSKAQGRRERRCGLAKSPAAGSPWFIRQGCRARKLPVDKCRGCLVHKVHSKAS